MKRCWLHIGMPKTGSTSVQVYLDRMCKVPGWRYFPGISTPNMNREMHAMFGSRAHEWYWFAKRGMSAEQIRSEGVWLRETLKRNIEECVEENIIISSEAFSLVDAAGVQALGDFLQPLVDDVKVIGYVRPPVGFMTSFFQQRIKNGHNQFDIAGTVAQYRDRFEKFDSVFGADNVLLKKFDPPTFPDKCFVSEFCQQLGMPAPEQGSVRRVNESLSREACGILYAYRKLGPGYGVGPDVIKENNRIILPLLSMGGAKFKVAESLVKPGLEAQKEDILWMEERLGTSLAERFEDDGTEVTSEEDLLRITRSSLEEFAAMYRDHHGLELKLSQLPEDDPVDPRRVATFIEHCRELSRKMIQYEREIRKKAKQDAKASRRTVRQKAVKLGSSAERPVKCCWVHIGMPKTGTTSIQVHLAKIPPTPDWCYLSGKGSAGMNREMQAMFGKDPHKWYWYAKRGESAEQVAQKGARLRARLARRIRNCGASNIVLSSEALSLIDKRGITALKQFLKPLCDEIRIIGYVRPPGEFKISFFQQRVKGGHAKFNIRKTRPNYRKRFTKFDSVFGRHNVVLRKFEPASFPNQCIVSDFCEQIGFPPPEPGSVRRVNESLSRDGLSILYAYRKFGPGYGVGPRAIRENNRIISALLAIGGDKFKLSKSLLGGSEQDVKDVIWMESRLGTSLKEELPADGSEVATEKDLLEVKHETCRRFVEHFQKLGGVRVPSRMIPKEDPVDPRRVAQLVEHCRILMRKREFRGKSFRRFFHFRMPRNLALRKLFGRETTCTRETEGATPNVSG